MCVQDDAAPVPMDPVVPACGTCTYGRWVTETLLRCQRYPYPWPQMQPDDWCGEFLKTK